MLSQEKLDQIKNAMLVGISQEDAYLLAGLTAEEMDEADGMPGLGVLRVELQHCLLSKLHDSIDKQFALGKDSSLIWSLEHLFPEKYSNKAQEVGGTITLKLDSGDALKADMEDFSHLEGGDMLEESDEDDLGDVNFGEDESRS